VLIYITGCQPTGHRAAGRIVSVKNSIDTFGNRTCDLPVCSAVPQPTVLTRFAYSRPYKRTCFEIYVLSVLLLLLLLSVGTAGTPPIALQPSRPFVL
jgi:hypothetical protein